MVHTTHAVYTVRDIGLCTGTLRTCGGVYRQRHCAVLSGAFETDVSSGRRRRRRRVTFAWGEWWTCNLPRGHHAAQHLALGRQGFAARGLLEGATVKVKDTSHEARLLSAGDAHRRDGGDEAHDVLRVWGAQGRGGAWVWGGKGKGGKGEE